MAKVTYALVSSDSMIFAQCNQGDRGLEVSRYSVYKGERNAPELKSFLDKNGIDDKAVLLVLSRERIVFKEISLPKATPEEIDNMIRYQLEKDILVESKDIYYTYAPAAEGTYLVALCPADYVNGLKRLLEAVGVKAARALITTSGLANLFDEEEYAVTYFIGEHAEVTVAQNHTIAFSHSFTTHGKTGEEISNEIRNVMASYRARAGVKNIPIFQLRGQAATRKILKEDALPVVVVEGSPARATDDLRLEGRDVPHDAALAPVFGFGNAFANGRAVLDLLRRPYTPPVFKVPKYAMPAGLAVLIILLAAGYLMYSISSLRQDAESLKTQAADLKRKVESLTRLQDNVNTAKSWNPAAVPLNKTWLKMEGQVDPTNIYLTEMSFEGNRIKMFGRGTERSRVLSLFESLKKDVDEIKLEFLKSGSSDKSFPVEFSIVGSIR